MSKVEIMSDENDFAAALPRHTSQLVVVSFVTPECRACKYTSRRFARVAEETSIENKTTFFQLDISNAPQLCRKLGVADVPQFQLYALPAMGAPVGLFDTAYGNRGVDKVRETVARFSSNQFDISQYVFENEYE